MPPIRKKLVSIAETPDRVYLYFEDDTIVVEKDDPRYPSIIDELVDKDDEILKMHKARKGFKRKGEA